MGREKPWGRVCQRAYFTVADPEEGPDPPPRLFFDQNEARRPVKIFLETGHSPYLRVWMTAPPAYLKVWMTAPPSSQGLDDSPPLYQGLDDRPPLFQGLDDRTPFISGSG